MARTVLLHVGAPKTGTSFVQSLLQTHRERLAEQGICYPGDRFDAHFLAALDLMQLPWGGLEKQAHGAWERLAAEVRAWPGTAIISHEILATASRGQVARAIESLAADEVHVIYSARDLARQIPAEWQENVKHRRQMTYGEFLAVLRDPARSDPVARWFWGVQEVPDVLDRWGALLPKERVHLVTVPPAGSPPSVLWERMASALRLDPGAFTDEESQEEPRTNASLGVAEAAMVRRLNVAIAETVENHHYRALVREALVHQSLSREVTSARLSVPPEVHAWAEQLSRSWVAELALRGYDVIGDLDDLLPAAPLPFVDPDTLGDAEMAEATMRGLAAMTLEGVRLRNRELELIAEIEELHAEINRAHSTPVYRIKQKLVAKASNSKAAAFGLRLYRRVFGRNSRSA